MKKIQLDTMTIGQLVSRFEELCIAQYDAKERDELSKYNRLFDQITAIMKELEFRPGDQRLALLPFHHHSNAQVRLVAAYATLSIAPAQSRAVFEKLVRDKEFPQALDAGMTLANLDEGIFRQT
jgi:hypothetical protein